MESLLVFGIHLVLARKWVGLMGCRVRGYNTLGKFAPLASVSGTSTTTKIVSTSHLCTYTDQSTSKMEVKKDFRSEGGSNT